MNKANYEYLLAYKITVPIYDYTVEFCKRWIDYKSRTKDQMEQAARSGMTNIPEGAKQNSLAGYIKLAGVARGSLEELLKDYLSYARQHQIPIWPKEEAIGKIGEIGVIWEIIRKNPTLPDSPNFPDLPDQPDLAINLMITLINQANYLVDKLIKSLEEKHEREGGYRERLLKKRLDFRRSLSVFLFFLLSLLFFFFSSSPVSAANSGIFSAEVWINPTSSVASKTILGKSEELRIFTDGSAFAGCQIKSTTWQTAAQATTNALALNTWSHVACTYDQVTLRIYVNGVQVGSQALTATIDDTANALKIGQDDSASTPYGNLSGTVDNFQFYNYARSAEQIRADMLGRTSQGGSALGVMMAGPRDEYTPISHWRFDEGYGTTAQDSGSNNQDLTLVNTPTWNNNGKLNKALDFESGSSQYGYAADSATLSITSSLTISAWIKPESVTASTLFDIAGKWDGANESYLLAQYGDEIRMYVDASANYKTTDAANLATGTWYHVTAVYDATAQTVTLYINGVPTAGTTSGTIPSSIGDDTGRFQVGAEDSTTTAANFYDGLIDEPKVYNFALTSDQVKIDYNAGSALRIGYSAGDDPETGLEASLAGNPPVAEWKMDEKTGTTANDTSGNGKTGTLTNGPTWTTGKIGSAVQFDGGDDFIDVGSGPSSVKTVEFWVNPATTTEYPIDLNGTAYIWINAGTVTAQGFTSPTIYVNGLVSSTVTAGSWQHIAVTTGTALNASDLDIGRIEDVGNHEGKIDQVKVFDYARSQAQIAYDYNRGGPVGYWKFDECQGGTAYDASGKGNNGAITIGATGTQDGIGTCTDGDTTNAWYNGVTGKRNSSLNFDGVDDYVDVGNASNLIKSTGTIELWVKPNFNQTDDTTYHPFIGFGTGSPATPRIFIWKRDPANVNVLELTFYGDDLVYNGVQVNTGTFSFVSGQWIHLVGTWETNNLRFYINGVYRGSDTSINTSITPTTTLTTGRATVEATPKYANAAIDEPKIYNYALTPLQVKQAYNEGSVRFGPSTGSP